MSILLNFEFLAILNLFMLLLWPSASYLAVPPTTPDKRSAISWLVLIVTIVVVFGDIVFLVLKMFGH
jgi:hypothetical protein